MVKGKQIKDSKQPFSENYFRTLKLSSIISALVKQELISSMTNSIYVFSPNLIKF